MAHVVVAEKRKDWSTVSFLAKELIIVNRMFIFRYWMTFGIFWTNRKLF